MARSLADGLNEMTDQDIQKLGHQIFKAYKAQRCTDGLMNTATIHGSALWSKLGGHVIILFCFVFFFEKKFIQIDA